MIIIAYFFKFLFKFRPIGRYHFALYKRVFKPYHLFRGLKAFTTYDRRFKISVEIDEWIQQHIFFFGVYDESGINFIKKQLNPTDVFIDIGANIGTYSLSAAACLEKEAGGIVYSFEPIPHIFEKFRNNIELNQLENIVSTRAAIFEENTTLELYVSNRENIGMSSMFHHDTESGEIEKVEAIKLDDFIETNQIKNVSLVKIDIEGAELFALKGMLNTIQQFKPSLIIEISESVLGENSLTCIEIFRLMESLGYSPYVIEPTGDLAPCVSESNNKVTNYVFVHGDR